jgi:threonine dehydratase
MVQESFPNQRFGRPCDSFDKYCDPANPVIVRGEQILDATHRIKPGIIRTPCNYSKMSRTLGLDLYLKKDYLQVTGSFKGMNISVFFVKLFIKERGARYALIKLSQEKRARGVISTSGTVFVLLVDFDTISRQFYICVQQ